MWLHGATSTPTPAPSGSQSFPEIIADIAGKALVIGIIVLVGYGVALISHVVIRRTVNRVVKGAKSKAAVTDTQAIDRSPLGRIRVVQRTRTLGSILRNIVNITIGVIVVLLAVWVINPTLLSSLTILSAAVGAGLGFGAQNLVKDMFNGIFIVAEDQIGIGDVADVGPAAGIVEYVSVRTTHIRDANGTLWFVRNGEINRIGNMSYGWSRVIIDVHIPPDSDLAGSEKLMLATANELAEDPKWESRIIESPQLWGLHSVKDDALVTRVVVKVHPSAKNDVAQELRMRLKFAFDEQGIVLPGLKSVMLEGSEGAQRVRGTDPPKTAPTPVSDADTRGGATWRKIGGGESDTASDSDAKQGND